MHRNILFFTLMFTFFPLSAEKINAEVKSPVVYEIDMFRETVLVASGAAMLGTNLFVKEFFPAETASEYGY